MLLCDIRFLIPPTVIPSSSSPSVGHFNDWWLWLSTLITAACMNDRIWLYFVRLIVLLDNYNHSFFLTADWVLMIMTDDYPQKPDQSFTAFWQASIKEKNSDSTTSLICCSVSIYLSTTFVTMSFSDSLKIVTCRAQYTPLP